MKPFSARLQAALVEYLDSCEVYGLTTLSSMQTLLVKLMLELGAQHQVSRWRTSICFLAEAMRRCVLHARALLSQP